MPSSCVLKRSKLVVALGGVLAAGCEGLVDLGPAATRQSAPLGVTGDLTVSSPNTVLNRYAVLASDAAAGSTQLEVTNINDLFDSSLGVVGPEDLLLIIQMQGAQIQTEDSASYGAVTDLRGAGMYEFVFVGSVSGNLVRLACGGLRNSYSASGRTQVIRVRQPRSLTIAPEASVVAPAWDGQRGGVVVLNIEGHTTLLGSIDVSGRGFRGGAMDLNGSNYNNMLYRSSLRDRGAEKGEGIAGDWSIYDTLGGRYGRGAPANGGGGGNAHNAGGGGGANGHNGHFWTGQGVMRGSGAGAAAWALDPGYIANGNSLTTSSGGGRGGYAYSETDVDAFTKGPGDSAWGGDHRRPVGGLGGRATDTDPSARLFLGGGGGAGDSNDMSGSAGGYGGGLVILLSATVEGTGQILANGADAADTVNAHSDGAGGGGAGGTIVIHSSELSGISLQADGGRGGSHLGTMLAAQGPGGGGGGGYIAVKGGTVTASARGGWGGTSTSPALSEFPSNGATDGAEGVASGARLDSIPSPSCQLANLSLSLTASSNLATRGAPLTYTLRVDNAGPTSASAVTVSFTLPAEATFSSASGTDWSCSAPSGSTVTCTYASLPREDTPELALTVVPTAAGVVLNAAASVSSSAVDLDMRDNSAALSVSTEPDSDQDGLSDSEELERGTDPRNPDSDGDGLADGLEVSSTGTQPLNADTDGGGVKDGEEVRRGTDPLSAADDAVRVMVLGLGCGTSGPGAVPGAALWGLLVLLGRRARPGRGAGGPQEPAAPHHPGARHGAVPRSGRAGPGRHHR